MYVGVNHSQMATFGNWHRRTHVAINKIVGPLLSALYNDRKITKYKHIDDALQFDNGSQEESCI